MKKKEIKKHTKSKIIEGEENGNTKTITTPKSNEPLQQTECSDRLLRLLAEFENYKKRTQKEKNDIISSTKIEMLSSIIDMENDLSIAINNINDNSTKEGVMLIYKKLEKFLKSYGIEPIQTELYDPEIHDVISVLGEGTKILEVVNKGWSINGKIFKHPKVILG